MAKILVADDNSNIQKMVGLALKDQGIDVVAVGNGEAAVRKISDVRPDLVLADVFMPVRNGYEVCQYVKMDSKLAHIPVILLVGAFDPLDEQEAQRVGADGVLKKPFVPPDPLISMVKSALARANASAAGAAAVAAKDEPIRAAEMLMPRSSPTTSTMAPLQEFPSLESEPVHEPVVSQPEPVKIDAGSQPLAFGSLLETPATEQEREEDLATTARPQLEHDWNAGEEPVEEEQEEGSASWRRDGGSEEIAQESESGGGASDWRDTAFAETPARGSRLEAWTPQKEISSFEEAAEVEDEVSAAIPEVAAAETNDAPAAKASFTADAWSAALSAKSTGMVEAATVEAPATKVHTPEAHTELSPSAPVNAAPAPEPAKPVSDNSCYSAVSSPWEAEVQKASKLASTWDDAAANGSWAAAKQEVPAEVVREVTHADPAATVDSLAPVLSEETQAKVEEAELPLAAVEEIREETHYVAENALEAHETENDAPASEPKMEDLVAKVLAKMNPEMLQAVTREILKPVVEAMVKDELNAKKK